MNNDHKRTSQGSETESVSYRRLAPLREEFADGAPFRHIVIDDFTDADVLRAIVEEDFADVGSERWTYHRYYSQRTYSRTERPTFGSHATVLIDRFRSAGFLRELAALTGHDDLLFDDELEDGGLQATMRDGYLNVHVDPLVHPTNRTWVRSVNLILYVDPDWHAEDGGDLELWNPEMTECVRRIAPQFNRCVIFESSERSLHGFPDTLRCDARASRKCIALYYYVDRGTALPLHFGRLYARPDDGLGRLLVPLDNALLHIYGAVGRTLGLDDRKLNRAMRWLGIGRRRNT